MLIRYRSPGQWGWLHHRTPILSEGHVNDALARNVAVALIVRARPLVNPWLTRAAELLGVPT